MSKSKNNSVEMMVKEAFSAEIKRLWKAAKNFPAEADIKIDAKTREIAVQFRFAEDISSAEVKASMERFIALFEEAASKSGIKTERTSETSREAVAPKSAAASKTLNESIGFAQPATVALIRLIPMLREGLESLYSRLAEANENCLQIRRLGVVNHRLGGISKSLGELKGNVDNLAPLIKRFDLFDKTEAAFIESKDADFYHDQGRECLGIARFLGAKLDELENQLTAFLN